MFRSTHHLRSIFRRQLHVHGPAPTASASPSPATLIFFGTPVLVTFSLGVWQVKRLLRKNYLIDQRRAHLFGTPFTSEQLYQQQDLSNDVDFHSVTLRGQFLHDQEMLVSPRSAPGHLPAAVLQWGGSSGLLVVTPCILDNKRIVLVNRGWIPHRLVHRNKRSVASVTPLPFLSDHHAPIVPNDSSGTIEFKAVVRNEQERNRFMPKNVPENNEWFYIDASEMISHCKMQHEKDKPVIVELCEPLPSNGWPFPRTLDQFLEFRTPPSTHVTYATTWFSLSIALAFLMRGRLRKKVNRQTR